jgi:5-hydroxyisourate hydrolase
MGTGYLTTHILDTARGCPAAGVRVELFRIEGDTRKSLSVMVTNADGRTDKPILGKGDLLPGIYELQFEMKDYFSQIAPETEYPFVGTVQLRFGIANADEHYHIPLLASPFSYSTYRGS